MTGQGLGVGYCIDIWLLLETWSCDGARARGRLLLGTWSCDRARAGLGTRSCGGARARGLEVSRARPSRQV